jgi:hypothetical protein
VERDAELARADVHHDERGDFRSVAIPSSHATADHFRKGVCHGKRHCLLVTRASGRMVRGVPVHLVKVTELVEEAIVRGWIHLLQRLDGPLHFRFIVQPTVAIVLGLRAGLRDARSGEAPFLAALWRGGHRREQLQEAWADVGKVFLVAVAIDVVYELWIQRGIYPLELIVTATLLALVPYALVRGPARRVAHLWLVRRGQFRARA